MKRLSAAARSKRTARISRATAVHLADSGLSSVSHETAYADAVTGSPASRQSRKRPAILLDGFPARRPRSVLGCYLIGSSYTGNGFGRCKSQSGKEYELIF